VIGNFLYEETGMKIFFNLIVVMLLVLPAGAAALCVQGDCLNGQGTVVLSDGRRYVGEFQDGIRTGRGLMTFPDGTRYLGDWQDDKPHGQGTLSSAGKFEYAGAFANGVREGQGTLEAVDGKKYTGQWQNDVPHGQGKITYPDDGFFIGQFENGRRNGQGEATYPDGTKYVGQWKDDLPTGHGTKIYADGEKYTGAFRNGLMHGSGTVINPDGSSYTGLWQNDVLIKKEEAAVESEFSSVDETEGHVVAVVDYKQVKPAMAAADNIPVMKEPVPVPAADIANTITGFASVNQNGVYVRSGPSTEYRIIRSVNRGFPVQVIGEKGNWSNIKDSVGQEGWIYKPLLGMNNSVIAIASKVNLRSGPGLNFTVVKQVDFGTVLQVNNIKSDWYLVATSDRMEGWLNRELLWPAGHAIAASQTVDNGEPIINEKAEETASASRVDATVVDSKLHAEMPETKVEPMSGAVVASATDVAVETAPAENVTISGTVQAESKGEFEYAGVAQNGKGANIRSEPSLAAEVLRSVPPGFPLVVLERQNEWALVQDFRERKGWVYSVLLTELNTLVIKVGKGNLRSGPSLRDEIIAKLDYGLVMFIDESRGDWVRVSNPEGLNGWLHHDVVWP
jgi:SH3-like domain-containing protein